MTRARLIAVLALLGVAVFAVAFVSGGSDDRYLVRAELTNAGGLREGLTVRIDGVPVGEITKAELDGRDRAVVEARIDDGAGPIGAGARATVRSANALGEKYLDLHAGDERRPMPSGAVIPASRSAVAVELDDVIDALDLPTRAALRVVLDESGGALRGRGPELGELLAILPRSLDRTGELLDELATDNQALGRLVERSDRVAAAVAPERRALGRMVAGAGTTLDTLAQRRRALGETVRRAPATLVSLQRALTALEGAALPLAPAARGLRRTAPELTRTLGQLPAFAKDARPTLRTARSVAPSLTTLGRSGTPLVRRLRPLAAELGDFGSGVAPAVGALDDSIADVLAVLEGWARSTAPHDGASHVFRAGLTVGSDLFKALVADPPATQRRRAGRDSDPVAPLAATPKLSLPELPRVHGLPDLPKVKLPKLPLPLPEVQLPGLPQQQRSGENLDGLLDFLMGP